jgi:flagellar hook protein FlgE
MLTSLFTGVSGMNANGIALSVIGDNIANINTVGFKSSRTSFGDVLSQNLTGVSGSSQVGRGVIVSSVSPLFTQGSTETTSSALDLAIDGDGFFMVNEGGARYYSRAGQFSLDRDGNIINPEGLILQGYLADAAGNITGTIGDLQIAGTQSLAYATLNGTLAVNLDATETTRTWTFTSPSTTAPATADFNKATTVTVYDSQGGAHDVTAHFVKNADNDWTVHYVYQDSAGQYVEAGTQNLAFGADGSLQNDNQAAITFAWGGGVANNSITFNYGTSVAEGGTGFDMTTQFASDFSIINLNQDGYASGFLRSVTISEDGIINGIFTNGQTRNIGQVALAKFISPTGLAKLGRNLYGESFDSGQPIVGVASTSGIGRLLSNSLELSNVDLAEEFVKMISAQRGFQANSRIITTTDELMQEVVNLKR